MYKFYNEDCMIDMVNFKDNEFDLAIVDPPYGIDFVSKGQIGNTKFESKDWDLKIPNDIYFKELKRISINQIIWGCNYFKILFPLKSFIFWNKLNHDNKGDGELAYTSFNVSNRYFEYMWDGNRYGFANMPIKGVGILSTRIHPTQKPVALYRWLLQNYAKPGDTILDTHVGSGSSIIACLEEGFEITGYEIDKDYYDSTCKRIEIYKSQIKIPF